MTKKAKSIVGGMTILSVSGIICKLIGMLYNVPLAHVLDDNGMGIYQGVYPTYNMLLTISSAGLPVAVSRMVAHYIAVDDPRNARRTFHAAIGLLAFLGCLCTLLVFLFRYPLADMVHQPEARYGFVAIAPCITVVCLLSAFRGYIQGQQNMVPTAISQLIEQLGKVFIALPLAMLGARQSQALGAAGALLGITLVEGCALIYMVILYLRKRNTLGNYQQDLEAAPRSKRGLARELLHISIPITIGACIVPLSQFVDSAMLVERMVVSGLDRVQAQAYYGLYQGLVIRLINIPTALALSISMSLMPAISTAVALHDADGIRRQSGLGLRFAFLIGLPCSIGMSLLSTQILHFFYGTARTAEQLQKASELLSISSLTIVLFTVVQTTSAILQGLHRQRLPMYTLVLGVGMKILANYFLVALPGMNIHGSPISSIVCYTASMLPNLYFCMRYGDMRFDWVNWLIRPGLATAVMTGVLLLLRGLFPINHLTTILLIAIGIAVFVASAILFRAVTKEDFAVFRRRKGRI